MSYPENEIIEIFKPGRADPIGYRGKVIVVLPVHTKRTKSTKRWEKDLAMRFECSIRAARWIASQGGFERDADYGPFSAETLSLPGDDSIVVETWSRRERGSK